MIKAERLYVWSRWNLDGHPTEGRLAALFVSERTERETTNIGLHAHLVGESIE